MRTYLSDRNIPLVCTDEPSDVPIITIENYLKWYRLYLVMPNGSVERLDSDEAITSITWHDHVPNPMDITLFAENHGYHVDGGALEMIVGRYIMETLAIEPDWLGASLSSVQHADLDVRAAHEREAFTRHLPSKSTSPFHFGA